jgi:CheY-like chemotaxis protein
MALTLGRILVVDDDATDRLKISLAVKKLGHAVASAEGGHQALQMLCSNSYDLVLLDLLMPEMDGFAVLGALKADPALCNIPVIVISSLDDPREIDKAVGLGAKDHLPKSFRTDLLKTRLNACLRAKSAGRDELDT